MVVNPDKKLTRLELQFDRGNWELATAKQYELLTRAEVWRAFLNSYTGRGFVVFDEEALPREKILETLKELNARVVAEKKLTVGELIESSYSWNNVLEKS
ncbi:MULTISPECIES: DUF3213 domain-containing protein [Thermococcus]|uniref:DUF3213 domain-containing protein n=1 Tax=Thermococcus TaxID=2263 RepID=UPI00142F796B|nr:MULTISPECIES: DUF3213 domain-containing protein [Thermococcus]NJE49799.1 DUF3213 domain-containing protein [Thermococcus sp. 9N3]CAI1492855.1 conserved protein of unknown function [Thermococcus nautili]